MINVIVTFTAHKGKAGALKEGIRGLLKEADDIPGLRYVKFARRIEDDGEEKFLIIAEYATSADLAVAMDKPPTPAQEALRELVASYTVEFWEAADVDFDPETAEPIRRAYAGARAG